MVVGGTGDPVEAQGVVGGADGPLGPGVVRGRRAAAAGTISLDRLVTDEGAAAVLVADLPVGRIGAEGGDRGTGITGRLEGEELLFGPVLGVAGNDDDV